MTFLRAEQFAQRNEKLIRWGLFISFGIIFCLIALVNHYNFRTYAYDLGIYLNAQYDYAHFRWNDNSVMLYQNLLSDHFTLLQLFIAPLYWVFGSYGLLLFQIASILVGGWGVYCYHRLRSENNITLSLLLLLHFFCIWGSYSALTFDYHDNVPAAMLVPWFFYYFHLKKWLPATLIFILICISKENMALWAAFLGFGLAIKYYDNKLQLKAGLAYGVSAFIFFIVIIKILMPALAVGDRAYLYTSTYSVLGNNMSEIIATLLTRPFFALEMLFRNHLPDPEGDWIKLELHVMVLLSGGIALLVRPAYLIMLIPIYLQKMYNDNFMRWGINYHYSIEFVPIINVALLEAVINKPFNAKKLYLVSTVVLITLLATFISFNARRSKYHDRAAIQFYRGKHYKRDFNVAKAHQALETIPVDVPVSASTSVHPHLALREQAYQFPTIGNAHYIVLLKSEHTWPLSPEQFQHKIDSLQQSGNWQLQYNEDHLLIFKHKRPEEQNRIIVPYK